MSKVLTPPTPIELDRLRHLRVDFNALIEIESEGRSIMDAASWAKMQVKDVIRMLYLALKWEDPELTPETVRGFIHVGNLEYVITQIGSAWTASSVEADPSLPLEIPVAA